MIFEIDDIYKIRLTNGYVFSAKCTELTTEYVTFTSKNGVQTRHRIDDIQYARVV
jgi:hypothetical protein